MVCYSPVIADLYYILIIMLTFRIGFISFLLIIENECNNRLLIEENSKRLNISIAWEILSLVPLEREFVLVTCSAKHYENDYIDFFVQHSYLPLKNFLTEEYERCGKSKNFIIPTNLEELSSSVDMYVRKRGFYFFILDEMNVNWNDTRIIFHVAWTHRRTFDLYLLTRDGIIAYDPFEYDYERMGYGIVVKLANRRSRSEIFKNLNKYPIVLEIIPSVYSFLHYNKDGKLQSASGADAYVAYEIQKRMNFTIILQEPDANNFGHILPNGSFNGALGRSITNQVDMTLTTYFIKDYFTRDAEFTVAVYSDQLCCYVPKADRVPQSILPLFSFSTSMWICFCTTALACAAVWSAIRYANLTLFNNIKGTLEKTSIKMFWQFVDIFVSTWIIWVRVSIRKYPKFNSEKLFLASVCLVSVIFGAIFESSLATIYIKPLFYKDLTSLEELDASGFTIFYKYPSMGDDTFAKGSSDLYTRLSNKMRFVTWKESLVKRMATQRNFASVTRKSTVSLDNVRYFADNMLYLVPECPKTYTLAYILPKDSPFSERVNMLLLEMLNGGLIDKLIDNMYYDAKLNDVKTNQRQYTGGAKILRISDLQLPFFILFAGAFLSLITLFAEKRYKRRMLKV